VCFTSFMHNPEASPLRGKANGARRPSDGTRRNRAMQLKLSEGELEQLRALADQRGLSIQRFLLEGALKGSAWERENVPVDVTVHELSRLQRDVARVGANVNQLARYAHTERQLADVDGARRAITDAMRSIEDFIDGMQRRR
jgi:hypothetical protein